jgi:zinc/manganese transport system substrate-binding protein
MRYTRLIVIVMLLALAVSANAGEHRLKVVATYSILGDLVANVGGDDIDLTVLVGADGDPHVYEPTPQDAVRLVEADIIFENGFEFESWLDELYEASGSTATRVDVSVGIEPLDFEEMGHDDAHEGEEAHEATPEADHEDEHEAEHHDEHGAFDPHIWHDPNNALVMIQNIRAALVTADPDHAVEFTRNATDYSAQLSELDAYIREQVATLPEANRVLVTNHDTFGYFAARYGFTILSALGALSTEAGDPGAGEIAELVEDIRAAGVKAIFAENIANSSLIPQIAAEAGVALGPELYTDALGQPGTPGATYLEFVRYNIDSIAGALR